MIDFNSGMFYINDTPIGKGKIEEVTVENTGRRDKSELGEMPLIPACSGFEMEIKMDLEEFNDLVGINNVSGPFTLEGIYTYSEQIRRHKKRRINKKWAKRYGYRDVIRKICFENTYIMPTDESTLA